MLRVALINETDESSGYQMLLSTGTDTISDILRLKQIDPKTKNIFLNGSRVKEELYDQPLTHFNVKTTMFITVKYKSFYNPRRASSK